MEQHEKDFPQKIAWFSFHHTRVERFMGGWSLNAVKYCGRIILQEGDREGSANDGSKSWDSITMPEVYLFNYFRRTADSRLAINESKSCSLRGWLIFPSQRSSLRSHRFADEQKWKHDQRLLKSWLQPFSCGFESCPSYFCRRQPCLGGVLPSRAASWSWRTGASGPGRMSSWLPLLCCCRPSRRDSPWSSRFGVSFRQFR